MTFIQDKAMKAQIKGKIKDEVIMITGNTDRTEDEVNIKEKFHHGDQ